MALMVLENNIMLNRKQLEKVEGKILPYGLWVCLKKTQIMPFGF